MILKIICDILFVIVILYGSYFLITGIIGLIKNKSINNEIKKQKHHFAIIIAARNEEKVIANLLDSLNNLDYPKDLYNVYVVPNNCTDKTKEIALKHQANIIECNETVTSKADVLRYAFNYLKDNKKIDAYLIFDADNVVDSNFLNSMNTCLNNGYKVAQGNREAKNPSDNWISGSYTIYYLFQNIFFNQARMNINGSSSINGTGFMIKKELIDNLGFDTKTLTEDVEYTGLCAMNNEKIAYVEDAITYDEYPTDFKSSWHQRKRWSAGIIECMKLYSLKLLKNFFKTGNISSLDMSLTYMGPVMQLVTFICTTTLFVIKFIEIKSPNSFIYLLSFSLIISLISYFCGVLVEIFSLIYKDKRISSVYRGIILFVFFTLTWIPINIVCLIKKQTKWVQIDHSRDIKIGDIAK